MDFSEENLETISSLNMHNMTIREAVEADSKIGSHFHYSRGVWWKEVRPFFYQPMPFIKPIIPHRTGPDPLKALGGFYHAVPDGAVSNGVIITNEISDSTNYETVIIKAKMRNQIKRALKSVRVCQVDNLDDLLDDGYQIYMDWVNRTNDNMTKQHDVQTYRNWITRVFHHPYVLILGAYYENRLIAFSTSYAVDGIAEGSRMYSINAYQNLYPSTALTYAMIKISQNNAGIKRIMNGLRSHKASLEKFKAKLGFSHVSYPAYVYIRPIIRSVVRWFMPIQYKRLMGQYDTDDSN
jgi:hypothetical protein